MSRVVCASAFAALICLAAVPASLDAAGRHTAGKAQTASAQSAGIPESRAGLESQLEAILGSAKDKNSQQFEDLISHLRMLDSTACGAKVAAAYDSNWASYENSLKNIFRSESRAGKGEVSATELQMHRQQRPF